MSTNPFVPEPLVAPPPFTPAEADEVKRLIRAYSGLRVEGYKLEYALAAAWPTLRALGIADAAALIRDLTLHGQRLWPAFLPFLTVNETYFMREPRQLEDFMARAVPELRARSAARGDVRLNLLSAPCSTGEEPYSLAILLARARIPARVLGADIDPVALGRAERGVYGPNAFRAVEEAWRAAHFEATAPNAWAIAPAYRTAVSFWRLNLMDAAQTFAGRRFDAIFCRNVLIYFDRPTQLEVIRQLRQLLHPGGYLFLGHSEMFFGVDLGLEVLSTEGATMYRRPLAG